MSYTQTPVRALSLTLVFGSALSFAACSSTVSTPLTSLLASDGGANGDDTRSDDSNGDDAGPDNTDGDDAATSNDAGTSKHDGGSATGDAAASSKDGGKDSGPNKADAGSSATETCSSAAACSAGGQLSFCVTSDANGCHSARYDFNGTSYPCNSCTDCTSAMNSAESDCNPSNGNGGTTTETCSAVNSSCSAGGTVQYCVTYASTGACVGARYTYGGQSYPCTDCTTCNDGYNGAMDVCMDAQNGCDQYAACCSYLTPAAQSGCLSTANQYRNTLGGDVTCKSFYDSYKSAGYCP